MDAEKKQSHFERLAAVNVNEHIEKKNGLSYLSWAWALDYMLREDPTANWEYRQQQSFGDTVMVFCSFTAFGKTMTAQLPVMDYKNRAIPNPDAFAVNTAMQRCLVKAIALHGLGLYIYAGEDLPEGEEKPAPAPRATPTGGAWEAVDKVTQERLLTLANEVKEFLDAGDIAGGVGHLEENNLDADLKTAIWTRFDSKQRAAIKKFQQEKK